MILETFVVTPFQENTYLVASESTRNAIIIDPGGDADMLIRAIEAGNYHVQRIINTHGHIDHVGAVQALKDRFDVPFCLHRADQFLLDHLPQIAEMYGIPISGVPEIDHYLNPGENITLDEIEFEVRFTPGHSPGSVSLVTNQNIVFSGDALFAGSIGRTDLPGGDHATLITSIQTQLLSLPDEFQVYSGHGPVTTIGQERRFNPFLQSV
ncbi:MAG: MBL fold metallo-hydrolase [Gemmatimonadetes bacterium]|nr:MAG: MBL fold metallo-hydrolase [Gemmatimonadota bacterium]